MTSRKGGKAGSPSKRRASHAHCDVSMGWCVPAEERAEMAAGRRSRNGRGASPKQARPWQPLRGIPACAAPESGDAAGRTPAATKRREAPLRPAAAAAAAAGGSQDAEVGTGKAEAEALSSGSARGGNTSDGSGASGASSAARRRHSLADVRRAIAAQARPR